MDTQLHQPCNSVPRKVKVPSTSSSISFTLILLRRILRWRGEAHFTVNFYKFNSYVLANKQAPKDLFGCISFSKTRGCFAEH